MSKSEKEKIYSVSHLKRRAISEHYLHDFVQITKISVFILSGTLCKRNKTFYIILVQETIGKYIIRERQIRLFRMGSQVWGPNVETMIDNQRNLWKKSHKTKRLVLFLIIIDIFARKHSFGTHQKILICKNVKTQNFLYKFLDLKLKWDCRELENFAKTVSVEFLGRVYSAGKMFLLELEYLVRVVNDSSRLHEFSSNMSGTIPLASLLINLTTINYILKCSKHFSCKHRSHTREIT